MTRPLLPWQIAIAGFAILAVSMGIGRFAFTPLLPLMQAEGLVGVGEGGLLASAHFAGYVMGALSAVRLTLSPRLLLFLSLVAIGLASAAMGLAGSYAVWIFARWLAGVCSAVVLVLVSTHLIGRLSGGGSLSGQGLVFAGVGGGTALTGFAVLGLSAAGLPSAAGWTFMGAVTMLVAVAVALRLPVYAVDQRAPAQASGPQPAPRARFWHLTIPYGAMGGAYIIPATYLPLMAQDLAANPAIYGWGWPVFGTAAMLSTLVAARLYSRWTARQVWIGSQCVLAVGLVLPVLWPHLAAVLLAGLCVGGTFMVITMAGIKEAHRIAGTAHAQQAIAWMTFAFGCGQIVGPAAAGWGYEIKGDFSAPLLIGAVVVSLSMAPLLWRVDEPSAIA